jgi:hypothetical protein
MLRYADALTNNTMTRTPLLYKKMTREEKKELEK